MDIVLWIIVAALFAASLIAVFFPVLPEMLLLWAGFLLYQFTIAGSGAGLPASFWWGMAIMTILLYGADFLTNAYFVKKYGGSKWSQFASIVGVILGAVLFPPFGIILFPFALVIIVEMIVQRQPLEHAVKAGVGSVVAFLGSAVMKVFLQIVMIVWFFLAI
ncbi:DUF456 family protein [Brevibacillus fluminis]|uniref:DUF456 family protein n=1 Tax=Brevibacillus fluminis TaxID=511487 RepID=A0A3M8DUH4_9BACL|nr:DUF456 family protein [Brevibacillus fluminis]RNB91746.1 DUF456 family protein [Brevibacillus fluminis]